MITVVNRSETSQVLPQVKKEAKEILPGTSGEVDIAVDHPAVVAKVNAGLIAVAASKTEAKTLLAEVAELAGETPIKPDAKSAA